MNIFSIACTLQNTVYELCAKLPPLMSRRSLRLQPPGSNNCTGPEAGALRPHSHGSSG
jgi:hypothetical protein